MNIVNFGSCNLDYVYRLHHIVKIGETEHSEHLDVFPGGKGLNQSIAAAKAGAKVYHAGCIGPDGALLRNTLQEGGVALDYLRTVEQPSGHAIIQVSEKGENSIFIHTGANGWFSEEYIDRVLERFGRGDLLLLQNEINNIDCIVKKAGEKGLITVFNPSPISEELDRLDFSKIAYLVLNEIEGEYLSGESESAKILSTLRRRYPHLKIVLTLGEKGCLYHDGEKLYRQGAYEVPAVDTTAAGDTFMGYFAAGLSAGLLPQELLTLSCAASALAVSKKGAAPSIPSLDEVNTALKTLKLKEEALGQENSLRRQIEAYLDLHLAEATLTGLAEELGYSAVYTGHLLKKLTKKSFSQSLQERRCFVASRLLLETDLPIAQIIHEVGYQNESFFREKFRRLYGISPIVYRKTMKPKPSL